MTSVIDENSKELVKYELISINQLIRQFEELHSTYNIKYHKICQDIFNTSSGKSKNTTNIYLNNITSNNDSPS